MNSIEINKDRFKTICKISSILIAILGSSLAISTIILSFTIQKTGYEHFFKGLTFVSTIGILSFTIIIIFFIWIIYSFVELVNTLYIKVNKKNLK